jgi:hypothetical protein
VGELSGAAIAVIAEAVSACEQRGRAESRRTVVVGLRLKPKVLEALTEIGYDTDRTATHVIRQAVLLYLKDCLARHPE